MAKMLLDKAKIKYTVYSDVKPNPTIENVQYGVMEYKKNNNSSKSVGASDWCVITVILYVEV